MMIRFAFFLLLSCVLLQAQYTPPRNGGAASSVPASGVTPGTYPVGDYTYQGNVSVGATVLGDAPIVPMLAAGAATFVTNPLGTAAWLSRDRSTLYSIAQTTLYKSTNDGGQGFGSWVPVHAGFPASIIGVRDLDNGELLVSIDQTGSTPGTLWLSAGYPALGASATWSQVLQAGASGHGPTAYFSGMWGMSCSKAICVVSEYGSQNAPTDSGRDVYLSSNSGATWALIYRHDDTPGTHIHGVAYDPWWDAIWLAVGDNLNRKLLISWDRGATWTLINSGSSAPQVVGILPMENVILFNTDSAPNGILRIPRTADRSIVQPVAAYSLSTASVLTHLGSMPYRAAGINMPALFPYRADVPGYRGGILATYDGYNFSKIWEEPADLTSFGPGPIYFVGPTLLGNYVGSSLQSNGTFAELTIPAAPQRVNDAVILQTTNAINVAEAVIRAEYPFTIAPVGWYMTAPTQGTPSANTRTLNVGYATPIYLREPCTLDRISLEVTGTGGAGSVVRLGVYGSLANGMPGALLLDAGTIDGTVVAVNEITINLTIPKAGMYWLVGVPQVASPTMRIHAGGIGWMGAATAVELSPAQSGCVVSGNTITGALPDPFPTADIGGGSPRVMVRIKSVP